MLKPHARFDMVSRSMVLRGEKPNKGVQAIESSNPHQMNRLIGYTLDGQKVVIAKRDGAAGMEFSKLMSGRIYAVAADACSPVFEKDDKGQATRKQKLEEGLPLYSASGFYSLSSKEYPSVDVAEAFVRFADTTGEVLLLLSQQQVDAAERTELESDIDLDVFLTRLTEVLSDDKNCLQGFVEQGNRMRKRVIDAAMAEAEDNNEAYAGVKYAELALSKKDGNPFVLLSVRIADEVFTTEILRESSSTREDKTIRQYYTAAEAIERFESSELGKAMAEALDKGLSVSAAFVAGNVLRTSVSFKGKVVKEATTPSPYGDGPFLRGARSGWVKSIVNVMYSKHPAFPGQDYDALYFVCSARQAEMGLNKSAGKWSAPQALQYDLASELSVQLSAHKRAA